MDLYVLIGIAIALLVIRVTLFFIQKMFRKKNDEEPLRTPGPVRIQSMGRRAQIPRNQRNRMRRNTAAAEDDVAADDVDPNGVGEDVSHSKVQLDEKMGTKKRAKLEAKEQKRMMREQELQMREEKKALEAKKDEERKKQDEKEAEEERKRVLAERLAREEQERKQHEEYLKMKEGFTVDGEGYEEDESQRENLLSDFIQYIKNNKVVVLEDLATEFKLKTQQAIDRVQELRGNGTLTGVIDDRGKFIYVSQDELLAMAKFIKQRGRVSIAELAESSNNLINLTPVTIG